MVNPRDIAGNAEEVHLWLASLCNFFFSFCFCFCLPFCIESEWTSRVPDQNGLSQACYIVEIHPSGVEPLIHLPFQEWDVFSYRFVVFKIPQYGLVLTAVP